ncbi:MAG: preprotein translocase subunit SecG, partial [Candidatus Omnitrophica bacterium]|nr:preprotein translocase subunit SecG [Candidatus Omnitrophota bacterium]
MLYGLVITIHVIVSLVLISVILLQAGRGGGLSESFGGSSTQTIL